MRKIRHKSDNLKRTGTGCRKVMSFILVLGLLLSLVPNGNMPGLVYGAGSNTEITEDVQPPEAASTAAEEASEEMTGAETTEAPELETTATEEAETSTEPVDGEGTTELTTTEPATEAVLAGDEPETRALSDYHAGDVAVINDLIQNNGLNWTYNDPDSWPIRGYGSFVEWSTTPGNKRIVLLYLRNAFTSSPDLSGLTQLKTLEFYADNGLTSLYVNGNPQLETLTFTSNNSIRYLYVNGNPQLETLSCNGCINLLSLDISNNPQLKTLNCIESALIQLDVRSLMQLETLNCNKNRKMTSLTVMDLPQLKTLNCDNNQLNNLVVRNLPQLKTLNCDNNQLNNLVAGNLSQLQELSCNSNWSIANLDVSQNSQLRILECGNNVLTNLNVSQNPQLEILSCGGNKLTNLDVSQNAQLKELYILLNQLTNLDVSQNLQLQKLYCAGNQLTNLDVSQNSQLQILHSYKNPITNLDMSQNLQLQELSCSDNQLTNLDLRQNLQLQKLNCSSNSLTDLNLIQNLQLQELNCSSNQLANLDVSQSSLLETLNCSSNQLANLDVSQSSLLETLNCSNNQLMNLDLSQKTKLRNLNCSSNNLISLGLHKVPVSAALSCGNNLNLGTIISSAGDMILLQAGLGGRVEFINMTKSNAVNLSVRAVPDSGVSFRKWDAPAGRLTYLSGNDTASNIMVNVATGADTTITALFSAPPSVSTPTFTNGGRTSVDFNGTYLANGYAMNYSANACRYRKVGDTTWSTAGTVLTYNDTAGTYAGSITGLTSNTAYELEVYFENTLSGTWSAPGTFVTTLDLTVDTPSINLPSLEATISGRYGVGDQPATVEVTYGLDPLLLTGAATINATVNPGLKTFTATIPGLTMGTPYYYQVTAVNSTSNSPVSSGILSFTLGHQVVVRHVDKTGTVLPGEAATGDLSYVTTSGSPYTVPTKTVTNYEPAYYTIGSNPTRYPLTTTQTITGATDITVYYASTLIRVVYPNTPMEFDALDTNHGNIKSPDYLFENQSDLPLRVSFKKMGVVNNAGLRFVTNAASRDEIHLNLEAAGSSNGFTNDLTGIVPDTTYTVPHVFGTLDGALPMSGDTGHNQGKLKIGGYFVGPFTVTAKRPQVEFTFNFYLMDP